jgi:hypothetical protein
MIRKALDHTDVLPISRRGVIRAIEDAKEEYLNAIFDHQWKLLREVERTKQIPNIENDREYPRMLANRCILEYRYREVVDDKLNRWYDVHPLVKNLDKFKTTV